MAQPYQIPTIAPKPANQLASSLQASGDAAAFTTSIQDQRHQNASAQYDRTTWESIKAEVISLVMELNMGPIAIEKHFRDKQPPFVANKRQWERRLKDWGLRKNLSAEKKRGLIKVQRIRLERQGKQTRFYYRGREYQEDLTPKLDRYMKGNLHEMAKIDSMPTPSTFSDITVFTPRDPPTPRESRPTNGSSYRTPIVIDDVSGDTDQSPSGHTNTSNHQTPIIIDDMSDDTNQSPSGYTDTSNSAVSFHIPSPASTVTEYAFEGQSPAPPLSSSDLNNYLDPLERLDISPTTPKPSSRYCQDDEERLLIELEVIEQTFGKESKEALPIMLKISEILCHQGRLNSSEMLACRVLKASKKFSKTNLIWETNIRLGGILYLQGRFQEAERLVLPIVLSLEKDSPTQNRHILYSGYYVLFVMCQSMKRNEECILWARKKLELGVKLYGKSEYRYCGDLGDMTIINHKNGLVGDEEALTELRNVVEGCRRTCSPVSLFTIDITANVIRALINMGNFDEASRMNAEVEPIAKRFLGTEHPETMRCHNYQAEICLQQGYKVQAKRILADSLKVHEKVLGRNHRSTRWVRCKLEGL